ncbi:MAG: hypothetical protein WAL72_20790 [Streptosporangiaceae bacterium]
MAHDITLRGIGGYHDLHRRRAPTPSCPTFRSRSGVAEDHGLAGGVVGAEKPDVARAAGILKYRLYEIDRIISRTLAYAIVTGLLVGVYANAV